MVYYAINNTNSLSHHGILGQKWGIRRYQNADGTLTAKGRKRYGSEENFNKVQEAKNAVESAKKASKANARTQNEINKIYSKAGIRKGKSVKEMTDEEIQVKINRLQLEKRLNELMPEQKTKGQKFTEFVSNKLVNEMIVPAAQKAGKNYIQAVIEDTLGVDVRKTGPVLRKSNNSQQTSQNDQKKKNDDDDDDD